MKKTVLFGIVIASLFFASGCGMGRSEALLAFSQPAAAVAQKKAESFRAHLAAPEEKEMAYAGQGPQVTVISDHGVKVVPDIAEISFGVQTFMPTAKEAQAQNAQEVNQVLDALKAKKVEEKDIRTTGYDLYPRYDNNGEAITGYTMATNLVISNQSVDAIGELVSACVDAGANQMYGITYTCSGYNEAYAEALGNATKAAKIKAEAIAKAAGKQLGDIIEIREGYQNTALRSTYQSISAKGEMEEAVMDIASVMPGEVDVQAAVTVTYAMK